MYTWFITKLELPVMDSTALKNQVSLGTNL